MRGKRKPDIRYLASLTDMVREGDMNAFAELYSATCQIQYAFALKMLDDEFEAQTVIEETYVQVLKSIPNLRDTSLITAFINRTNFILCLKRRSVREEKHFADPLSESVDCDGVRYSIRRISNLPLTESQSILLVFYSRYSIRETGVILELSSSAVRHYISNGLQRLRGVQFKGGEE